MDEARLRLVLDKQLRALPGVAAQQDLRAALHALLDARDLDRARCLELTSVEGRRVEGVGANAAEAHFQEARGGHGARAGSPCVGPACARDRAVLPEPAMAERLPPRGCFTLASSATLAKRCGPALRARQTPRLRWVCTHIHVRGVGRTDASSSEKPVTLALGFF